MPWYRFDIEVALPSAEVSARIQSLIRAPPGFWQSVRETFGSVGAGQPPFLGQVMGDSFRIRRDIRYRNSFLPVIRGHIQPTPTGSLVRVSMSLHPAVAVFMAVWLTGVSGVGVAMLNSPYALRDSAQLVPIGLFLFGIGLTLGGFIPEAIKAKRLLVGALGPPINGVMAGVGR
jgi:hypothetical protein